MISNRPFRICRQVDCDALTKNTYCKEHEHVERDKELIRHKRYNKRRDPTIVKFYTSKEWVRLRTHVMHKHDSLCVACTIPGINPVIADLVDHIIPVEVDWSLRLEISNCQPLCHGCHNRKTAKDKKKYNL